MPLQTAENVQTHTHADFASFTIAVSARTHAVKNSRHCHATPCPRLAAPFHARPGRRVLETSSGRQLRVRGVVVRRESVDMDLRRGWGLLSDGVREVARDWSAEWGLMLNRSTPATPPPPPPRELGLRDSAKFERAAAVASMFSGHPVGGSKRSLSGKGGSGPSSLGGSQSPKSRSHTVSVCSAINWASSFAAAAMRDRRSARFAGAGSSM